MIPCRPGGERLKKRRETNITRACLDYLRVLENAKQIAWAQRMNSGKVRIERRSITLCRAGTADIYVRLNNGFTVWIENKMPGETLKPDQIEFKNRMEEIGDSYLIITSIQEFRLLIDSLIQPVEKI